MCNTIGFVPGGILLLPLLRNGSGGIKAVLSAVLSACSIRTQLRNGTQVKTPSPLMKYPLRPQKRPGLSAKTAGLNIKASYRIGPGAKGLTAHIVKGKNKAAANHTIPVDSLPLHFMISFASQSSHTYWPLWSTIFLYSTISPSLTTA